MKLNKFNQIIFAISVVFLLLFSALTKSYAQTESSASTEVKTENTGKPEQVEDLKERLATKVAQLNDIEKKAYSGNIKKISVASFTIETATKELKIELNDNLATYKVINNKKTKIKFEDLKEGQLITLFGDYDKNLDLMKAKIIYTEPEMPKLLFGIVSQVNKKDFSYTLTNPDKPEYIIDFEKITKAYKLSTETKDLEKIGFSDIGSGSFIVSYVSENKENPNRYSASRITLMPDFSNAKENPETIISSDSSKIKNN